MKSSQKSKISLSSKKSQKKLGAGKNNDFTDCLPSRCLTQEQLNKIPQCCPCPGAENYQPTCICVQQTPRIMCRKNVVWVQKLSYEPSVVNATKIVMVPKVVKIERPVRVPEVVWTEGFVHVPKIQRKKCCVTKNEIKHTSKSICAPQEICTRFLCRPKPQWVCIPPPTDYCCYSMDSLNQMPGGDMCPPSLPGYPPQNGWGGGWHGSPGWSGGWPGYPPGSGGGWTCPNPCPPQCPPCPPPFPHCPPPFQPCPPPFPPCPESCPPQCPPCPPGPPCPPRCPPYPLQCPIGGRR